MSTSTITPIQLAEKAWDLYQTHGVPIELSTDILEQNGMQLDTDHLNSLIDAHQKKSQESSAGQFKSGLGADTTKTRRLHTVTHILHKILRDMFGTEVKQKGSAITDEKARFDVTLDVTPTPDQITELTQKVQDVVNKHLAMTFEETTPEKAREMGAIGLFGEKYGDMVTVYTIQDDAGTIYSREFCGGPHIENTREIGTFSILKVKSIGQGLKRFEYTVE